MSELRVGVVGVGVMGADHAERVVRKTSGARLVAGRPVRCGAGAAYHHQQWLMMTARPSVKIASMIVSLREVYRGRSPSVFMNLL